MKIKFIKGDSVCLICKPNLKMIVTGFTDGLIKVKRQDNKMSLVFFLSY
ncbi:hypothetical protein SAMN05444144_104277 [Flavobacterium akiainvivens]|nr:hypothetical protein SAMN05444144_104277 [Flavobacterium akiainvivens]